MHIWKKFGKCVIWLNLSVIRFFTSDIVWRSGYWTCSLISDLSKKEMILKFSLSVNQKPLIMLVIEFHNILNYFQLCILYLTSFMLYFEWFFIKSKSPLKYFLLLILLFIPSKWITLILKLQYNEQKLKTL